MPMKNLMNSSRAIKLILVVITLFLILVPFFWFKPGEMDLGGDSGRLYFYDPLFILKNIALYIIDPQGTGNIEPYTHTLPPLILTSIIKSILHSPYLVISLFNSLKLSIGFLAVYAFIKELLNIKNSKNKIIIELASIIGGLFYIFSPMFIGNFDRALSNHNQVFLNPLMLFLLLRFLLSKKSLYIAIIFIMSLIFSENFSWVSAPPFFAFYPLGILFVFSYVIFIRKIQIDLKILFLCLLIFIFLHSFHLFPSFASLFQGGSSINSRVFNTGDGSNLNYFYGILSIAKLSLNIFAYSDLKGFTSVVAPFILILGLLFNDKKQKTIVLTSLIFLIILFLITANITNLGVLFYSKLFFIPGFNMFRNFIGQWQFVFYFFYSILFGQAFFLILSKVSKKSAFIFFLMIGLFFVITSWQFINGTLVNKIHFQSKGVKYAMVMDPQFEKMLFNIRSLSDDSKILTLPFTDYSYQVIHGTNNGAYVGISAISNLAGKKDFAGYSIIAPFSGVFLELAKKKDYDSIKKLLGILNIRYIYYNSDPKIYDTNYFPSYPYQYVRTFFPSDQKGYVPFVKSISEKEIFKVNNYKLYSSDKNLYLPHIYIAKRINAYENKANDWFGKTESFFVGDGNNEPRVVYLEKDTCLKKFSRDICEKNNEFKEVPKIIFEKINPTKYKITVYNAESPYIFVFSDTYHNSWKLFDSTNKNNTFSGKLEGFVGDMAKTLAGKFIKEPKDKGISASYFDGFIKEGIHREDFLNSLTFETWGKKTIAENNHFQVNGYANAWYIEPKDMGGKRSYEIILEMTRQKTFYIGLTISVFTLIAFLLWGIFIIIKDIGIIKYINKSYKNGNKK